MLSIGDRVSWSSLIDGEEVKGTITGFKDDDFVFITSDTGGQWQVVSSILRRVGRAANAVVLKTIG